MNSSDVIRIAPDPIKQLGLLTYASLMVSGSLAILVSMIGGLAWFLSSGWILVVILVAVFFFGFLITSAVLGRPCVEIGPDGFVNRSLFSSQSHGWADIQGEFAVIKHGWRKVVAYRLATRNPSQVERKPHPYLGEYDACVNPGKMTAEELAALLNKRKQSNDPSSAPVSDTGAKPTVLEPGTETTLNKTYPSWAGVAIALPSCALAGLILAKDTHHFTQAQGVIGGAAAGLLAGLIIWAIDLLRSRGRKTQS